MLNAGDGHNRSGAVVGHLMFMYKVELCSSSSSSVGRRNGVTWPFLSGDGLMDEGRQRHARVRFSFSRSL